MPHVGRILILVRTDDDRVGGKVREVETEGEGSLAELLDQPGLELGLLVLLLLWRVDLHSVKDELLLEGETQGLVLLPAVSEGDHQLDEDPPSLEHSLTHQNYSQGNVVSLIIQLFQRYDQQNDKDIIARSRFLYTPTLVLKHCEYFHGSIYIFKFKECKVLRSLGQFKILLSIQNS